MRWRTKACALCAGTCAVPATPFSGTPATNRYALDQCWACDGRGKVRELAVAS